MTDDIVRLVEGALGSPWGLLALAAVAAVDGFFPVVPSESLVVTAGVFAADGHQSLALVIAAAAIGAFIGDHVSYGVGRRAGDRLTGRRRTGTRRAAASTWAARILAQRGATVIIVARYIPGGRTAVAVTAGAVRHPLSSFSPYDAIAAASWATYAALVGFLGGAAFDGEPVKGVLVGLGLALSVAGAIELVRHLRRRGQPVIADPDRVSSTAADHGYRGRGPGSSRVRRQAHDLRLDVSAEARCGSRLPNGGFS